MKQLCPWFLSILACAGFMGALGPSIARADTCEKWVAKAVSVQGLVEARRAGESQWQQVKLNDTFCPLDVIRVQKRSRADIALSNQPVLHLDQNTVITIGGVKEKGTSLIELVGGAVHFFSRIVRGLEVQTAFVNAGVEGTEFFMRVEEDKASLSVFEGKVFASNKEGSLEVTGGQSAVAEAGKAPVARVVVRPRDAVQWALYYPPVVSYRPAEFQGEDWQAMVKKSFESYGKGDLAGAFSSLEGVPEDIRDPRFFIYRAALLLTVGRVDEARSDVDQALRLEPQNSNAFALQSIIAVTQNEKEKALTLAKKAVDTGPQSATARVALSYAQQAAFDLKGALTSLNEAVKLEPENALAWARLAELQMSFGELDDALKAAQKAVTLNPDLSRTQTILGFAYLTRVRIKESQAAFTKAIELDNADPLPRLGLGLSMIREGRLEEGGREIEIAASLDPDNSIIRSYLGKTYFEEKRDKQAADDLAMAEQFDPSDPTPLFYDAVLKQMTNRPVEALHDLQKAIELNDNRAVYRSRLLLDADLAARSAGLARIYSDLGFQQLALAEGWKSENTDPADFSGHRFLADSYAALPRREIARVSELLQSQLLQPLNITPIQPHLAESNQFVISGAGPSDLSANEFNTLFNRNRAALQASGIVGDNGTRGAEATVSGVANNASLSVGHFNYTTNGFRPNSDLKDNISNAFEQISLTPQTSVQIEFRYRKTESGDRTLRFLPDDFFPNQRQEQKTKSARFGFHHAFSPGSDLIGTVMYQNLNNSFHDSPDPVLVNLDIKTDEDAYASELQHLFRSNYLKTITGAGYFRIHREDVENDELLLPVDPSDPASPLAATQLPSTTSDLHVIHRNLYVYSYVTYPKNVTFTAGASGDSFRGGIVDKNQLNPKFGITWNPVPDTTLRAAYFRALKRTLITNQTLEPTQVAGFNQFFDDADATDAWSRGAAVDQKFSPNLYGGAEYTLRDLDVPYNFTDLTTGVSEVRHVDWDERLARAYLYWTPQNWLALSAEYQNERITRAKEFVGIDRVRELETQRFPLGFTIYHPSGLSAALKATFYHQKGEFQPQGAAGFDSQNNPIFVDGKDDFWLFDAAVSYRLPKRTGSLTVGAKNLFDKTFQFADTDPNNPSIQPKRFLYARATVAF